jgi:hypothetical protein
MEFIELKPFSDLAGKLRHGIESVFAMWDMPVSSPES